MRLLLAMSSVGSLVIYQSLSRSHSCSPAAPFRDKRPPEWGVCQTTVWSHSPLTQDRRPQAPELKQRCFSCVVLALSGPCMTGARVASLTYDSSAQFQSVPNSAVTVAFSSVVILQTRLVSRHSCLAPRHSYGCTRFSRQSINGISLHFAPAHLPPPWLHIHNKKKPVLPPKNK